MKRSIGVLVLALAACSGPPGGTPQAATEDPNDVETPTVGSVTAAPSPSASATHTFATTPAPAEKVATHITESVSELMGLSTEADIADWIRAESDWTDMQELTVTFRPYFIAILEAMSDVAFESRALQVTALDIIDAARDVPGVELP